MKDIVGFYQSRQQAEQVRDALVRAGFDRSDIKIYAHDASAAGGNQTSFWDEVKAAFGFADDSDQSLYAEAARRGSVAVGVNVDSDDEAAVQTATTIMKQQQPIDLDAHSQKWRAEGWNAAGRSGATATPTTRTATASTGAGKTADSTRRGDVIPVVEEQLQVGKQVVQTGGVRVHTRVTQKPVEADVRLREEHVNVERRAVDRPLSDADQPFQERSFEVTETGERAVVAKNARVVEEVVVNKTARERTEKVHDTVRRTDVQVEQTPGSTQGSSTGSTTNADTFVNELAGDARYHGRNWDAIEPEVRSNYERRYPGSTWEQVKDSVRRGWDKARQKV